MLTNSATVLNEDANRPIAMSDGYDPAEELLDTLFVSDDTAYFSDIRFEGEFFDPSIFNSVYDSEKNRANMMKQAATVNANDMTSVVAKLYSGNREYLLAMDVARFDDKWYVCNAQGNISIILDINSHLYGMIPLDYDGTEEIRELVE